MVNSFFRWMLVLKTKLALLVIVMALSAGLTSNAFAHKSQVVGDYLIEVGWKVKKHLKNYQVSECIMK